MPPRASLERLALIGLIAGGLGFAWCYLAAFGAAFVDDRSVYLFHALVVGGPASAVMLASLAFLIEHAWKGYAVAVAAPALFLGYSFLVLDVSGAWWITAATPFPALVLVGSGAFAATRALVCRRYRGRCPRCDYPLEGIQQPRCPECGKASVVMEDQLSSGA